MKIIYLHGYKGENSSKFEIMKEFLSNYEVVKPTQIEMSPLKTIDKVSSLIDNTDERIFIVASSRGGIFGQYLSRNYDIPILLINPVFKPYNDFKKKLANDFKADEIETIFDELNQIHNKTLEMNYSADLTNIWLAKNDEVLNHDDLIAHYDKSCIEFFNTDHRFSIFTDKLEDLRKVIEKYS